MFLDDLSYRAVLICLVVFLQNLAPKFGSTSRLPIVAYMRFGHNYSDFEKILGTR